MREVEDFLDENFDSYEILLVEDRSDTETAQIAEKLSQEPSIKHLHSEKRGKGVSIEKGIQESQAEKIGFMDADLSTDINHVKEFYHELDRHDIVVGSRRTESRSVKREIPSRFFNSSLDLLFGTGIEDHQCGFKFFRKTSIEPVLEEVDDEHFFWDAELIVKAEEKDLDIKEKSVLWEEKEGSEVDILRTGKAFALKSLKLKKDQLL